MSSFETYQAIAEEVCSLDRYILIERLTRFDSGLPLDFTPEYLDTCSTDQIRHLLVAALWRCQMKQPA